MNPKFELVVLNGRIIDPEREVEFVGNLGINNGVIEYIGSNSVKGVKELDCTGLTISPGFIDLHSHGQDRENYLIQASDGVTSALELEYGTDDVEAWYSSRKGKACVNYGVSVGHIPVRTTIMNDPGGVTTQISELKGDIIRLPIGDGANKPASELEIKRINKMIEVGLRNGAVAVGMGIAYTPGASWWEVLEVFKLAFKFNAVCHVHMRGWGPSPPNDAVEGLSELIAASAISGASLHLVHIGSSGNVMVPELLSMIKDACLNGLDVTTECYPYSAGMTGIEAPMLNEGWQQKTGMDYADLEWADTGERLDENTFNKYRETGGMVILHMIPDKIVDLAVSSDITMIATDGYIKNGKGHPRTAGSYSKVLGEYVRTKKSISLINAIRKMSLMPALRLQKLVPSMKNKGRIKIGSDADLAIFDSDKITDNATYSNPTLQPVGMVHVIVNGKIVVENEKVDLTADYGKPIRSTNKYNRFID